MARRVAEIKSKYGSMDNVMQLDAGGYYESYSFSNIRRSGLLIDVHDHIGMTAVNVGSDDLGKNPDAIMNSVKGRKTPYLSANIVDKETGKHLFQEYILFEQNEQTIAITGITKMVKKPWQLDSGEQIVTLDPAEVLKELVPELREKADAVIVLAYLPKRKLKRILKDIHGIDIIFGADKFSLTRKEMKIENTRIFYTGTEGKMIGFASFGINDGKVTNFRQELVHLTLDKKEDPATKSFIAEKQLLNERRLKYSEKQ